LKLAVFLTTFAIQNSSAVDTLTKSYSKKWEAAGHMDQAGPIMQFMASNDLIFVVLGVSLIIWLVLLFTLFRLDRKVSSLEEQVNASNHPSE
jgi:hypothetical protein